MTKEQEEAIEIIDKMRKSHIEADECGLSNNDFKYEIRAMQTVLSMLKEKDTELKKKDKIIDLMAEFLGEKDMGYYKKEEGGEFLGIMRRYSKEDWKQYFERKVKHEN